MVVSVTFSFFLQNTEKNNNFTGRLTDSAVLGHRPASVRLWYLSWKSLPRSIINIPCIVSFLVIYDQISCHVWRAQCAQFFLYFPNKLIYIFIYCLIFFGILSYEASRKSAVAYMELNCRKLLYVSWSGRLIKLCYHWQDVEWL